MILTARYPHVRDLVSYYAHKMSDKRVLSILSIGIDSEIEAEYLSYFIWKMLDEMAKDREEGNAVLGSVDNTSMGLDISYEMDCLMEDCGYSHVWERISNDS